MGSRQQSFIIQTKRKKNKKKIQNCPCQCSDKMSFIGPVIPSQLSENQDCHDSGSDGSDEDYGPRLPSSGCRGPAIQSSSPKAPETANDSDSDDDDDDYGPSLPPHLLQRQQSSQEQQDDSSDEEFIGPKITERTTESNKEEISQEVELRALRMREKLDGRDNKEIKRESWMLELPEEKANRFGLGPRQFSRKGVTERGGDRSAWTDSPAEKERKLKEGESGKGAFDNQSAAVRIRDQKMEEVSNDLKQKRGTDSLMESHEKKLKREKKEKKESGEVAGRRPFDRDIDLKANQFDQARKKNMLKAAAKIDNRFSTGSQKFL